MNVLPYQIASALLWGAAGFCVFLVLLNRAMILMRDGKRKTPVILGTFALLVGTGTVVGFVLARPPWVFLPVTVLGLVLLGEGRRALIRRACAGSPPVDTTPHRVDITTPVTTTDIVAHRYRVSPPSWRGPRLRIAHLTDLHVHATLPVEYYQDVLSIAVGMEPDVAVFTGDFISGVDALPKLRAVLRPVARLETYAVLGNHDYWAGPEAVRGVIRDAGLRLLSGDSHRLSLQGHEIRVTGYDYPWGTKDRRLPPQPRSDLHIVLSHTPDNIYRISESPADMVFSGHYHAGQIRVPVLGPVVVPSVHGRRFDHGHFVIRDTHLFVASGIGAASPPLRIYCQPDIFVVDIVPESHS